jgi:Domain of unknown function (DUF6268)
VVVSFLSSLSPRLVCAQPYIDLVNAGYLNSPHIGRVGKNKNPTRLDYFNISTTLPFQFNNKQDALILRPFFEKWTSRVASVNNFSDFHYGLALPLTLLISVPHSKWTLLTTAIVRMNDAEINRRGQWQYGGALMIAKQVSKDLAFKLGIYLNSEFFGLFVVPLLGMDWRISDRANLFGLLPASLTLEYALNKRFYAGAVVRTFTNSYHDTGANYIRIDENQAGLFLDYYPAKRLVLNFEAGHSILRKVRSGDWHNTKYDWNADDNFYFKLSVAYRLRIRN